MGQEPDEAWIGVRGKPENDAGRRRALNLSPFRVRHHYFVRLFATASRPLALPRLLFAHALPQSRRP